MKEIVKFKSFFVEIGELCSKIYAVERPIEPFLLKENGGCMINNNYLDINKRKKYPNAVMVFYVAILKRSKSIQFFLTENSTVIAEFISEDFEIEKTIVYNSVIDAKRAMPFYINFLTRNWSLL